MSHMSQAVSLLSKLLTHAPGMAGSDEVENAQVAAAVDAVMGLQMELMKCVFEGDQEKRVRACVHASALGIALHYIQCDLGCSDEGVDRDETARQTGFL